VEGDDILQCADQIAYSGDRESWHTANSTGARLGCITFAATSARWPLTFTRHGALARVCVGCAVIRHVCEPDGD
jgi:hypothetical protein